MDHSFCKGAHTSVGRQAPRTFPTGLTCGIGTRGKECQRYTAERWVRGRSCRRACRSRKRWRSGTRRPCR